MSSLNELRVELIGLAGDLRPLLLERRFAELERMGLPAGKSFGDVVSGSRPLQIPVDKEGDLKDRLDKGIRDARKAYRELLEQARKSLDQARAVERGWLIEIHVATKDEAAQASDLGVDCLACARPVACTPVDPIREGFCEACSRKWRRLGKPDRVKFVRMVRSEMAEGARHEIPTA